MDTKNMPIPVVELLWGKWCEKKCILFAVPRTVLV